MSGGLLETGHGGVAAQVVALQILNFRRVWNCGNLGGGLVDFIANMGRRRSSLNLDVPRLHYLTKNSVVVAEAAKGRNENITRKPVFFWEKKNEMLGPRYMYYRHMYHVSE